MTRVVAPDYKPVDKSVAIGMLSTLAMSGGAKGNMFNADYQERQRREQQQRIKDAQAAAAKHREKQQQEAKAREKQRQEAAKEAARLREKQLKGDRAKWH
eukprot:Protomagalhaensia_wolfi_Nauph_80__4812@NODE_5018_length_460_cov_32_054632_g4084_i0_p2_GENE_NODE_5018_length_460_cov_32_054632_g4084_i0NODE_5018_length_460_cov_32_054632_g4084_i0_p2_ORF_typecomplete_len100_score25_62MMR1/PF08505_10/0_016Borrelia_P83/PF05262_11/0_02OrfB_IS605/PF01385_19/0_06G0G1_switch_2/PF15103_6/0_11U79_P34/PF03064_16/0_093DUF4831/PF16115_5/0_4CBP_BcsG/PF11658_8/0_55DUF4834/PF16118_5/1_1RNA_pol_Rpc4/PF05132_14/0_87Cytadhesin_P30/PF07271_11/0_94PAP_PilO/PF06864_12/6_4DOR/PF14839_